MTTGTTPSDFKPGDVVLYNAQSAWKLVEIVKETAKQITWRFEYLRADFEPGRVGKVATHTFRKTSVFPLA